MKKQDRSTAITITLVLIVCTITLVAVGSFLWQLISPAFGIAGDVLGLQLNTVRGNYNFSVEYTHAEGRVVVLTDDSTPAEDSNTVELIEEVAELPEKANDETNDNDIELEGDSGINYNFPLPSKN